MAVQSVEQVALAEVPHLRGRKGMNRRARGTVRTALVICRSSQTSKLDGGKGRNHEEVWIGTELIEKGL